MDSSLQIVSRDVENLQKKKKRSKNVPMSVNVITVRSLISTHNVPYIVGQGGILQAISYVSAVHDVMYYVV